MSQITKQIILIRKDLKMRRGKEIAQGCHASQLAVMECQRSLSLMNLYEDDDATPYADLQKGRAYADWMKNSFTKIVLVVNSEEELLELYKKGQELGCAASLVLDNGTTEFGGVKTHTAVALGPHWSGQLDTITGHLKTY